MPPPRPSLTLVFLVSLAAHFGIFALVGSLRQVGSPQDAGADIMSVKVLVEDSRPSHTAPAPPERVRLERPMWTPRETPVPPSRTGAAQGRPDRSPASAQSLAALEPAGGLTMMRAALHPATLVPILSPALPAPMKRLVGAPEPRVHESVPEASLPSVVPGPAQPPADARPREGPEAPRVEPPAEKARRVGRGEASASLITQVSPLYPRYCRIHGEEGTVVLEVEIGADGKVERVSVVEPSGYRRLDAAAVDALRNARYRPAMRSGQPVPSTKRVAVAFRLRDAEPAGDSE